MSDKDGDVLRDGETLRCGGFTFMDHDSVRLLDDNGEIRATIVTDAYGRPPARRPGYAFDANPFARDEAIVAREEYIDRMTNAWRGGDDRVRSMAERLAEAKTQARTSNASAGREDPSTALSKRYRAKQTAETPFGGTRAPDDAGGNESERQFMEFTCPACGAIHGSGGDDDDDDTVNHVVRAKTQNYTERQVRSDVPDSLPRLQAKRQAAQDASIAAYELELQSAWKTQS
jgi:hypothetical protein